MHTPVTPTPLDLICVDLPDIDSEWMVVPWCDGEADDAVVAFDKMTGGQMLAARESGEWQGKRFDLLTFPLQSGAGRARRLAVVGAGPVADYSPEIARRVAAAVAMQARDRSAGTIAFVHKIPSGCPAADLFPVSAWIQAVAEGLTLAGFDGGRYKSTTPRPPVHPRIVIAPGSATASNPAAMERAAWRGRQVGHCANLARELVNEPGNQLPPRVLAERARELTSGTNLAIEVLDDREIRDLGMGLLWAVGQGSKEPPRLIVITHEPQRGGGGTDGPVLGLVGKGVTFDSGGLSIKTAEGMERMKDDMSGGAAVIAAMRAIALLDIPVRVVAVVPSAENMPGGGALRPGDVLRGASGRTVEVINTDAEGRLILGDALWFARQRGATHLVDIATLTGACAVALGKLTAGVFGRPDAWRDTVLQAAHRSGEPCWPLPLVEEERDQLDSEIADTTNAGSRYGGAITAALFIGEFAGDTPWAHIDIAGPAWLSEGKRYAVKGATGYGVRTLVELASHLAAQTRATAP